MLLLVFTVALSFSQEKIMDIHILNLICMGKGGDDEITVFRIKTNNDGFICSIEPINNPTLYTPIINIEKDRITINSNDDWIYAINEILIRDKEILVRGGEKSIYTKDGGKFLPISINNTTNILYEHDEIKLILQNENSLEELFKVNPSRFSCLTYVDNILISDYRFKKNTMNRFEYTALPDRYLVTYFYIDDVYSPPIEIRGDNLYTHDIQKNVINYFILQSTFELLSDILFPFIFLETPIKKVSSKIKENNNNFIQETVYEFDIEEHLGKELNIGDTGSRLQNKPKIIFWICIFIFSVIVTILILKNRSC